MSAVETNHPNREAQMERLASLLLLESRVRDSPTELELGFTIVNDTLSLVSASTALLWRNENDGNFSKGSIFALSGSPLPEKNTPFAKWATPYCDGLNDQFGQNLTVVEENLPSTDLNQKAKEFVAAQAVWIPLEHRGFYLGSLVLWRKYPWTEAELRILQQWAKTIAHAWHALRFSAASTLGRWSVSSRRNIFYAVGIFFLLSLVLPVRLSVLAPAELKSSKSIIVRSPVQGVVDELHVRSNDRVEEGQLLISLDDTALTTELEVAQQELKIARAEFRQSSQAAAFDSDASANLQVQRITVEKYVAEVNYLSELLSRTKIYASQSATIIVENKNEFVGRPVQLGERLVTLVDNEDLELELWLPVGDDIQLSHGSEIRFFPNAAPDQVYYGEMTAMDYEAQVSPLGTLAYRVTAQITVPDDAFSRIGMRGTGKLHGERVSLFFYLFRRPVSFLRQATGI